jgi:predicted RNA binding protein YcfA (HicA-like mRNA interferase family)
MPSEVRFSPVRRLVETHGWVSVRIRGSHHVLKTSDGSLDSIPVHHGKVKPLYAREIKKQVGES